MARRLHINLEFPDDFGFAQAKAETGRDLTRVHQRANAAVTRRAAELFEDRILRQAEHETDDETARRGKTRGLTKKLFTTNGGAVRGDVTSTNGRYVMAWPNTERLDNKARYWRSAEFGLSQIELPKTGGIFVNRGGGRVAPRPGTRSHIFLPYGQYRRLYGESESRIGDKKFPGPSKYVRTRRARKKAPSYRIPHKTVQTSGVAREGKHFLRDAWQEVAPTIGDDYIAVFDRNWKKFE